VLAHIEAGDLGTISQERFDRSGVSVAHCRS
jgi:hypothetical protein